jgi:hypothetical protein
VHSHLSLSEKGRNQTDIFPDTEVVGRDLPSLGVPRQRNSRYAIFQMAEVVVPRQMLREILSLIARLRAPPAPA